MKKQLLAEVNRLKEIMGLKPQLLTEGFAKAWISFIKMWYKGGTKSVKDDVFLWLLKSADPEATFKEVAQGAWEGTTKTAKDLCNDFPNLESFRRGLDDDLMSPNEAELLMRLVKHGEYLDEMVDGMLQSPALMKHFKELFPSGKVGKEGLETLAAELNTDVADELVIVLARRLNKDLPKITIGPTPGFKIPLTKYKIPSKTFRIKIPSIVYAFNRANLKKVLSSRKFWTGALKWIFGIALASEISKAGQKMVGWGVYGASTSKLVFSPEFYLDKIAYYEEINDYDWIERNELDEAEVSLIIQELKTAGVGAYADFDTDDDAIVNIYQNRIKTVFQAAQIAEEWLEVEDGNLEEDILTSMNFPIQIVSSEWLAGVATAGINSILPDWVGEVDWTDDNIRKIYNIVMKYDDYIDEEGKGVREDISYTIGPTEQKKMFKRIINYPPELENEEGEIYCTTRGYKILLVAWVELTKAQPSWQGATNYLENMDPEVFNAIHKEAISIHEPVYVLSEDGDCSHIEVGEPSKEDYKKDFDANYEIIQEIVSGKDEG